MTVFDEKDKDLKTTKQIKWLTSTIPHYCSILNKRLEGTTFVCGDRLTIADFSVFAYVSATLGNEHHECYFTLSFILD